MIAALEVAFRSGMSSRSDLRGGDPHVLRRRGGCQAIHDHLREIVRDNWGLSMGQIQTLTGMRRRILQKTLDVMVAGSLLKMEGGRYVAR